jgi:hypothetical protein
MYYVSYISSVTGQSKFAGVQAEYGLSGGIN